MIYCILGNSGAGKDTVVNCLLQQPQLHLTKIKQVTTRPMRPGEVEGDDYYYISKEFFETLQQYSNMIICDQLIKGEWLYGVLNTKIKPGRLDYILPASSELFVKLYWKFNHNEVIPIVLDVDDDIRKQRMIEHGDDPAEIERRFTGDENYIDISKIHHQLVVDNNGKLSDTVNTIAEQIYHNMFNKGSIEWSLHKGERPLIDNSGTSMFDAIFSSFIK